MRWRRRSSEFNKAFSLAEMLVACALLGLVSLCLTKLLLPSFDLFSVHTASSESQLSALAFSQRLQLELSNTYTETLTVIPNPPSISLHPVVQEGVPFAADSGQPLMEDHFLIFTFDRVSGEIRVLKRSPAAYDFSNNTLPLRLLPADLVAAVGTTQTGDRVGARNVTDFRINDSLGPAGNNLVLPLALTVVAEVKSRNKMESWEGTVKVSPRNERW